MSAQSIELAEAVVEAINGHDFGQPILAVRAYLPTWDLKNVKVLRVNVVPFKRVRASESRAQDGIDQTIIIGVQKECDPQDLASVDALVEVVEAIEEFFNRTQITGAQGTKFLWKSDQIEPVFDPKSLLELQVFRSFINLVFKHIAVP